MASPGEDVVVLDPRRNQSMEKGYKALPHFYCWGLF
jgi:hypothetical protein